MPHTSPKPGDFRRQALLLAPVTSGLIRQNSAAVPADAALPSILVTNPVRLYRF